MNSSFSFGFTCVSVQWPLVSHACFTISLHFVWSCATLHHSLTSSCTTWLSVCMSCLHHYLTSFFYQVYIVCKFQVVYRVSMYWYSHFSVAYRVHDSLWVGEKGYWWYRVISGHPLDQTLILNHSPSSCPTRIQLLLLPWWIHFVNCKSSLN